MTDWIIYGTPGIGIAINEFIGKKEKSSIWFHKIWIINPIIIFIGVYYVKLILPPWKLFSIKFSIFAPKSLFMIYGGMIASLSVFSGKIAKTYFFNFWTLFTVLSFNLSVEFTDKFEGLGYLKFKMMRESARFFSFILNSILYEIFYCWTTSSIYLFVNWAVISGGIAF